MTTAETVLVVQDQRTIEIVTQATLAVSVIGPTISEGTVLDEAVIQFTASCSASEQVGDFVYVAGSGPDVRKVDIDDWGKMPGVGMVISKSTATSCVVQTSGEIPEDVLTGLTVSRLLYYIGVDSKVALSPFVRPLTGTRYIQAAGTAIGATRFVLRLSSPIGVLPS